MKVIIQEVDNIPPIIRNANKQQIIAYQTPISKYLSYKLADVKDNKEIQIAIANGYKMKHVKQEQHFVNKLIPHFLKENSINDCMIFSTMTPYDISPTGEINFIDDQVVFLALNNSLNLFMYQGIMKNEMKQISKLKIWLKRYKSQINKIKEASGVIITPGFIYTKLFMWGKEIPLKVIIKMSGEWADYIREFASLHALGYRNFVIFLMRNHTANQFKLMKFDFRGSKLVIMEDPAIKDNSRERNWAVRSPCPFCLAPAKDTKPLTNNGNHHCNKCQMNWIVKDNIPISTAGEFKDKIEYKQCDII